MSWVMIQQGTANGEPLPGDGQYLKSFDFEANDGRGEIELTPSLLEAKIFPSPFAAIYFIHTVPERFPLRADLEPNRPLTAANWEIHQVGGRGRMTDQYPIVRKLTRTEPEPRYSTRSGAETYSTDELVNPDGPEAAALLKECAEALELLLNPDGHDNMNRRFAQQVLTKLRT